MLDLLVAVGAELGGFVAGLLGAGDGRIARGLRVRELVAELLRLGGAAGLLGFEGVAQDLQLGGGLGRLGAQRREFAAEELAVLFELAPRGVPGLGVAPA